MNPLAKKLQIKEGLKCSFLNIPNDFNEEFNSRLKEFQHKKLKPGTADFVHLFVLNSLQLNENLPNAVKLLKYDGIFWISYPKRSSKVETDLNRDELWKLLIDKGLKAVSAISVNSTWSALRFRPVEMVKSTKK